MSTTFVNFTTHGIELNSSQKLVLDESCDVNWALYSYNDHSFDLNLDLTGRNGLEELVSHFDKAKIQYAFVKVIEPSKNICRYVFISWCGDNVQVSRKALFYSHVRDVEKFFKGSHLQISARNFDEVSPELILKKVRETYSTKLTFQHPTIPFKGAAAPAVSKPVPVASVANSNSFTQPKVQEHQEPVNKHLTLASASSKAPASVGSLEALAVINSVKQAASITNLAAENQSKPPAMQNSSSVSSGFVSSRLQDSSSTSTSNLRSPLSQLNKNSQSVLGSSISISDISISPAINKKITAFDPEKLKEDADLKIQKQRDHRNKLETAMVERAKAEQEGSIDLKQASLDIPAPNTLSHDASFKPDAEVPQNTEAEITTSTKPGAVPSVPPKTLAKATSMEIPSIRFVHPKAQPISSQSAILSKKPATIPSGTGSTGSLNKASSAYSLSTTSAPPAPSPLSKRQSQSITAIAPDVTHKNAVEAPAQQEVSKPAVPEADIEQKNAIIKSAVDAAAREVLKALSHLQADPLNATKILEIQKEAERRAREQAILLVNQMFAQKAASNDSNGASKINTGETDQQQKLIRDQLAMSETANQARLEREAKLRVEAERKAQEEAERLERLEAERVEAERKAKEEAARLERLETERKAKAEAERLARLEAERLEAERKAKEESERLARLEAERLETERKAKEEAARLERLETERKAKEETERLERLETERKAKVEAERLARLETERLEAERKAKEEAARLERLETERKAKEETERLERLEAERKAKAEAERLARLETERLEAEHKAKEEAERKAKEEAKRLARLEAERLEAERKAQEEAKRLEAERQAKEEAERLERLEAERKSKEEAERLERLEAERLARLEAERKAKEETARLERLEAERKAKEEAERLARLETERLEAERKAQEEAKRLEAEQKAREEAERLERLEAERKAKEEAERLAKEEAEQRERVEAERKAKEEVERLARLEAERIAKEEKERLERLEAELKAKEEAERLERLEIERKAIEEAKQQALEEAQRLERQEAELKAKEEAERKVKEEASAKSDRKFSVENALREQQAALAAAAAAVVFATLKSENEPAPIPVEAAEEVEVIESKLVATAVYTWIANETEGNEITIHEGEKVTNVHRIDLGWWQGTNIHGEVGLFPANYVEVENPQDADDNYDQLLQAAQKNEPTVPEVVDGDSEELSNVTVTALYDYKALEEGEISLSAGETVYHVSFTSADWWFGYAKEQWGLFPSNYVQVNETSLGN